MSKDSCKGLLSCGAVSIVDTEGDISAYILSIYRYIILSLQQYLV